MNGYKTLFHKIGGVMPPELGGSKDLFLSALVPRTSATLVVVVVVSAELCFEIKVLPGLPMICLHRSRSLVQCR